MARQISTTWTQPAAHHRQPVGPGVQTGSRGLHTGIIFISGNNWKAQRRCGLMALRALGVGKKVMEGHIQNEAQWLLESFAMMKGKDTDPNTAIVHSVSNVLSTIVFGHRFSTTDSDFAELIDATDCVINMGGSIWGRLFDVFPSLMRYLPGGQQKMFKFNAFLHQFFEKEIRSHKESGTPEESQDIIDFYLSQMSKASDKMTSALNEENLIHLSMDIFMAGIETTTTTLLWSIIHMLNHPHIQVKVQQELDAVVGPMHVIEYEDRKRLPYTNAVVHEIHRFSNVVSVGIVRQVIKETELQGFHVKKGTVILPNISSVLYDPECWETPRQFNPSHFLDKEGNFIAKEAFLAFSAGHRVCLGEQLAKTVVFLFFANLLRAYTFQLPEGVKQASTDYTLRSTLKPLPFKICAVAR
ncbi:cytochrome P450 2J4-like isoform X2 [Lissotriton helveticus]